MIKTPEFQLRIDARSGVPFYRQIIDQVLAGLATGALASGDQLPTVRQLAVDLAINPNTVVRAYRELEIRGILATHQGSGTFIADKQVAPDEAERNRRLGHLVGEFVARAGGEGFTVREVLESIEELFTEGKARS